MTSTGTSKASLFGLLAIVVGVFAVYWPGLGGGFAFDDYPNIVLNKFLHVKDLDGPDWLAAMFSSNAGRLQRPLAMLSFAIQHYFTGLAPAPMKFANIAIHALNAVLVFGLCRAILRTMGGDERRDTWAAMAMAALWAFFPINLMGVLFIVQRMESLSHTFVFAGLWIYVLGRHRQMQGMPGLGLAVCGLAFGGVLGVMCKESAVLLPLYSFLLEVFVFGFRGPAGRRDRRLHWLYAIVLLLPAIAAVAWLLPKAMSENAYARRDFDLGERLLTQPRVLIDYLRWTIFPPLSELGLYHDDYPVSRGLLSPPSTLLGLVLVPSLIALAIALRSRRPLLCLGIAWFFAAQALTATFIPLELVFEHRNYFASLGVAIALVDLLLLAPRDQTRKQLGAAVLLVTVVMHAGLTHLRAREWRDPLSFAQTEASKHPDSPRATYALAQLLVALSKGDKHSAIGQEAFAALERARRAPNSNVLPVQGLLLFAAQTGSPLKDEWWDELTSKLATRPIGPQERGALASLNECAISRRCHFPPGRMLTVFAAALSRRDDLEVLNVYGNYALNVLGDRPLAENIAREVSARAPRNLQYRENLIRVLIAFGKYDEARAQIAVLRESGRFGSARTRADAMERRLEKARLKTAPGH
ncbi:hypothetical protein [Arenimonas sp.]|uniref:hypothetical protein n=1 Tax=Arenimonas sp. TaxID=1872635 RepID=UPI0039E6F363